MQAANPVKATGDLMAALAVALVACALLGGWLTDRFGLCWQIVPEKISEILKHPKAMAAMMSTVKFDIATLEAAARE